MRIAIVHYHLKRGGVTKVIESTLRGFMELDNRPQCVVLAGEVPEGFRFAEQARAVDGLHYSNHQSSTPEAITLLERMQSTAREVLGGAPDVWHIHNHSLGKNSAMPGVVAALAKAGQPILLHMHDFAEDGRPVNFRINQERSGSAPLLYPGGDHVHYGVLNDRDYQIFQQAGLNTNRLHLLANPVEAHVSSRSYDSAALLNTLRAERLFLYPVRAVRRKNLGEMLLWAALAPKGDVFATTLGPTNQNFLAAYQRWQSFASKQHLTAHFGIGEQYDWPFEAIMQSADAILSTSIAEGFGLAFLEPWLCGKAIVGRDLPDITADFKTNHIQFAGLYRSIPIPRDWIDLSTLKDALRNGLTESYAAYERKLPDDSVERALTAISPTADTIDFAGLNEPLQESVIGHVLKDANAKSALPQLPMLASAASIQSNAGIVAENYSLPKYIDRLTDIYRKTQSAENTARNQSIEPAAILDHFLQPERFRLLRT